jgi:hypothetical protein
VDQTARGAGRLVENNDHELSGDLTMNIDKAVLAFAGLMVLASVALAHFVSPWWLLLTAFAGANMLQASVTGFCPAAMIFKKLGFRSGEAFR